MRIFQVSQQETGVILWVGGAVTADNALEIMAHEARYRNFGDVPREVIGAVSVSILAL